MFLLNKNLSFFKLQNQDEYKERISCLEHTTLLTTFLTFLKQTCLVMSNGFVNNHTTLIFENFL